MAADAPPDRPAPDAAPSFSLVLGAGGRPGLAYIAGTLLALELHGFTPGDAASVTGTSAGSIATAVLASGATVEDLSAYTAGATPRDQFRDMETLIRAADARRLRVDGAALRQLVDVRRALTAAAHLRARRFTAAFVAVLPGVVDITRRFAFLDGGPDAPPIVPWRIVAAELSGRRHVFRAGDAPLSLAVAASCAVPGLFAPIHHGGRRLVDGGLHSTTNADLAVEDASATVIVVAPMCPRDADRTPFKAPAEATLDEEVEQLRSAGRRVVLFRPSGRLRQQMGRNPLASKRCREITAAAFLEASDVLVEIGPRRRLRAAAAG